MRKLHLTLFTLFFLLCSTSLKSQSKKIEFEGYVFLKQVNDTALTAYQGKITLDKKNFKYKGKTNDVTVQNNQLLRTNNFTIPIESIKEITLIDKYYENQQLFQFKLGNSFMQFSSIDSKSLVDNIKSRQK
jgi:hypothetical protein